MGERLEGKRALVTGGGRGIGRAIARLFAAEGARVAVVARTEADLAETASGSGGRIVHRTCDVTNPAHVRESVAWAVEGLGGLDILVNNAGESTSAPFLEIDLRTWNRMFTVNATSALLFSQGALPRMIERGCGRIVMLASIAGKQGGKYVAAYSAAKHAMLGLMRCLAIEAAEKGVLVNAVCPGYVDTPMTAANLERISKRTGLPPAEVRRKIEARGRFLAPEEVAEAVLALSLDSETRSGEAIDL